MRRGRRFALATAAALALWMVAGGSVLAGGGPENVVLVVDPADGRAQAVANHYMTARGIPASHVLYLPSSAESYAAFATFQLPALLGTLRQRGMEDEVDVVILASSQDFYLPAPNLIAGYIPPGGGTEQCPVRRISLTSAWTLAPIAADILGGGLTFSEPNRYYANNDTPTAFDGGQTWYGGRPNTGPLARRYLLGFQLGYGGQRGNTITETLALIDRSVAADGTRPAGTFYFLRNDDIRSRTRTPFFDLAVDTLTRLGFQAQIVDGILPEDRHDALGILAGSAAPPIRAGDFSLVPGAWADHLTSYAAMFDTGSQVKMSEWVPKGASGTMGTVEEPCVFGSDQSFAYNEKFPHPRILTFYAQGMSLGEALFRSIPFTPFQGMFYGDPLTRPFAYLPDVTVPDSPTAPVSGLLTLTPQATTARPNGGIAGFDLFVDGQRMATAAPGEPLHLNTHLVPDGPRKVRVVAYDDSPAKVQGEWRGVVEVRNQPGRAVALSADRTAGLSSTVFHLTVQATGGDVAEVQLRHNGRVLAAQQAAEETFLVAGDLVGVGSPVVEAVAVFRDGGLATSAPVVLTVTPDPADWMAACPATAPASYSYNLDVLPGVPMIVDLPATSSCGTLPVRQVTRPPMQATVESAGGAFLVRPAEGATGVDPLTFVATVEGSPSPPAAVTLRYCEPPVFTGQPRSVVDCLGQPVQLTAAADGAWTYQWFKDDAPIPGAFDATYAIPSLRATDEGLYHVVAYARCGATWLEAASNAVEVRHGDCAAPSLFLPWAGSGR